MSTTVARLEAVLSANTRDFEKDIDRSESKMRSAGKAAGLLGLALAGGLAVGAHKAIEDASNLHEQINKADVVFRGSEKVIQKWSKTTAKSLGESRREALQMAGTFGNMLVPMGYARKEAANMSIKLVKLSADMASFNNASPEDTLQALQSGLAGQVRPLREFGVFLSKTRIEAEAFATGIAKPTVNLEKLKVAQIGAELALKDYQAAIKEHGKGSDEAAAAEARWLSKQGMLQKALAGQKDELTAAQKAQATYQIIMKDTADSQGDFARTSGGLANQQRILRAEFEDVSAQLGMVLLPAATKVAGVMIRFLNYLHEHQNVTKVFIASIVTLTAALLAAAAAQAALNLAVLANPYVAVTVALIAFAAAVFLVWERFKQLRPVVEFFVEQMVGLPLPLRLVLAGLGGVQGAADKAHKPIMLLADAFHTVANWVGKCVQYVKDLVSWLGKIHVPKFHLPNVNPFGGGDPANPKFVPPGVKGPADLHGASEVMRPFANQAARYGLHITAGRTDHSKYTSHGTISDHWLGKALDEADGASNMAAFFRSLVGNPRVKQAFYDPLGSIFGGAWSSYREGGHSDHVHVATYDQGGWPRPGWNLAYNGLGRPEPVGAAPGGDINLFVDGQRLFTWFKSAERRDNRRNGR